MQDIVVIVAFFGALIYVCRALVAHFKPAPKGCGLGCTQCKIVPAKMVVKN